MKKNIKNILTFFSFFLLNIIIDYLLPTVSISNIIDLILRLTINALFLLTLIYLFHIEIYEDLKKIKENPKRYLSYFAIYLSMLILSIIISSLFGFITSRSAGATIFKIDYLYKKIPVYLFINNVLLLPLIHTIIFRYIINLFQSKKIVYILISTLIFTLYSVLVLNSQILLTVLVGIILSLSYVKSKNIAIVFIINTILSMILFLIHYL